MELDKKLNQPLAEYLKHLGDNTLILAQRLSEWCGHGPVLEEDLAITNVALDLIGQTRLWLGLAADIDDTGGDADSLAYQRDVLDFRNALLVELPNGDFATTAARQFLFDHWQLLALAELSRSSLQPLADIAAKSHKEVRYHTDRSDQWVRILGDGTPVSRERFETALNALWSYTGELFEVKQGDQALIDAGIITDMSLLHRQWRDDITSVLDQASLATPPDEYMQRGGRDGMHSEHLGYLLAEMQFLQRAYPGAEW
ncbi:MAG: phenylacetic acid degradation protein [marine bacterium B5-7]|nr:MAG: phenylacetic acid degradation protein [marine bacterium B5-7]